MAANIRSRWRKCTIHDQSTTQESIKSPEDGGCPILERIILRIKKKGRRVSAKIQIEGQGGNKRAECSTSWRRRSRTTRRSKTPPPRSPPATPMRAEGPRTGPIVRRDYQRLAFCVDTRRLSDGSDGCLWLRPFVHEEHAVT